MSVDPAAQLVASGMSEAGVDQLLAAIGARLPGAAVVNVDEYDKSRFSIELTIGPLGLRPSLAVHSADPIDEQVQWYAELIEVRSMLELSQLESPRAVLLQRLAEATQGSEAPRGALVRIAWSLFEEDVIDASERDWLEQWMPKLARSER